MNTCPSVPLVYRVKLINTSVGARVAEGGGGMLSLTREREARRWSRNELARRAQMAAGDLGRIESGRLRPYDSQLRKLAKALGWPIADAQRLLDVVEPEPASVSQEAT